ncbi:MAG TPA: IclR family transcriptional regulator [Gaiellaceae bacterium]|nr:IclR family transcriptional regulator [Gaiellaceae bacterium]
MRNKVQTVDRALQILESFEDEAEARGVSELATRLGVHRSTASRLVATLEGRGFLERVPGSEVVRLGPRLGRLGLLASRHRDLTELARRPMESLAERTGETVTLAIRDGDETITIRQVDARYVVGVKNWVGRRAPLHCTSDGKVLLAFGNGGVSAGQLRALTARTIVTRTALADQLVEIRRRGWATALEEFEEGLHGVAAPVLDGAGGCRAALSVSGPAYRIPADALPGLAAECARAADQIGSLLVTTSDGV